MLEVAGVVGARGGRLEGGLGRRVGVHPEILNHNILHHSAGTASHYTSWYKNKRGDKRGQEQDMDNMIVIWYIFD